MNTLEIFRNKCKLLLWYKDPAKFFRDMYGTLPYPYQERVMRELSDLNIKRVLICASAGTGKTKLVACHALWLAIPLAEYLKRPVSIVIISGSEDQAKNLYNYIKEAIKNNQIISSMVEGEPLASRTQFKNGSEILAVPNSLKAIQGLHKDVVIIDEPVLAGDFILRDSFRITVKDKSLDRIIFLGTPMQYDSLFVEMWEDQDRYTNWKRYHWSAYDCPTISHERLEEAKNLPEDIYSIFWEGKPYALKNTLIPFEELKRASMNIRTEFDPNLKSYAGIDWGYTAETVLTIIQIRDGICYVILSEGWKREEFENLHDKIEELCKQYNVDTIFVDNEDIGENQRLEARGLRIIPVVFNKEKTALQARLKSVFHQNKIRIDENMIKLKNQLKKYNWDTKVNDDRVDSLMLALKGIDIEKEKEERKDILFKVI